MKIRRIKAEGFSFSTFQTSTFGCAPLAQKFSRIQRWEWSEQVRGLENERLGLDFLKAELAGQGLGLRVRCGMKGEWKVNFSGDLLGGSFVGENGLVGFGDSAGFA